MKIKVLLHIETSWFSQFTPSSKSTGFCKL